MVSVLVKKSSDHEFFELAFPDLLTVMFLDQLHNDLSLRKILRQRIPVDQISLTEFENQVPGVWIAVQKCEVNVIAELELHNIISPFFPGGLLLILVVKRLNEPKELLLCITQICKFNLATNDTVHQLNRRQQVCSPVCSVNLLYKFGKVFFS